MKGGNGDGDDTDGVDDEPSLADGRLGLIYPLFLLT